MVLTALKDFSWAHRGVEVEHYQAGQEIDTDDVDLIRVATDEGWVESEGQKASKPTENRARTKRNTKNQEAA